MMWRRWRCWRNRLRLRDGQLILGGCRYLLFGGSFCFGVHISHCLHGGLEAFILSEHYV